MKSQIHSYRLMESCQRLKIDGMLAERSDSLTDGKLPDRSDSLRAEVKYEVTNTQLKIDGKLAEVKD